MKTQPRIQPSLRLGFLIVLGYMVVVNGIQLTTGIPYDEWFDTPANAPEPTAARS